MVHTLKKYLSNRGSALFMVVSTMTALLVCCMAMYFSVISSRSTQYAIFNQQQSYQSAVSLADTIISGMISGESDFADFTGRLWNLEVDGKLTTESNGFAAFDSNGVGKDDDVSAGAYMVTATRLPDETLASGVQARVFDIAITTSVNGIKEVYHSIILMEEEGKKEGNYGVFNSTGYLPNDVYLDGGVMMTDVFFDNPQTVLNAYGSKNMELYGDLACGGSLTNNKYIIMKSSRPQNFIVRDTYRANANQVITFAEPKPKDTSTLEKNKAKSIVAIGGDCHLSNQANFSNANVYILGDLYLNGTDLIDTCTYYVDGDVYRESGNAKMSIIYANGKTHDCSAPAGKWTGTAKGKDIDGIMTVSEAVDFINEKTASRTFYKWKVEEQSVTETLEFNTDLTKPHPTEYLAYSDTSKGCVIEDVVMHHPNNGGPNNLTLLIDTGDKPENVYTIQLRGNRDYRGDTTKETFCWYPENDVNDQSTWKGNGSNVPFTILVKGRGSVVIDIPEGVTYQDDDHLKLMHYGWFVLNGGEEKFVGTSKEGLTQEQIIELTEFKRKGDSGGDDKFFYQFIHHECYDGDGCTYTEEDSAKKCKKCEKAGKDVTMKKIVCASHGEIKTYCPTCSPNEMAKEKNCNYRIDKPAIDSFLSSHYEMKKRMTDKNGKVIYPNVNIFLVSCDENADIRLSSRAAADADKDAEVFIQNGFFGYVYAPYVTFRAGPSNSGGGMVRFLGGLTVSDYIIDDSYSLLACFPDRLPDEVMGENSEVVEGVVSSGWKITLRAH